MGFDEFPHLMQRDKKLTPYFKNARARRRRKKWVLQSPIMRGKEGKPILMEGESQFVSRPLPIIRGEGDQHPCSGDRSWDSATQNKIAPAAHHFFIIAVFCKELDIRFFSGIAVFINKLDIRA